MIVYKRLDNNMPSDVAVVTDNANSEMDSMRGIIGINVELPAEVDPDDNNFHFVIPGDAVAEFAGLISDIDGGSLAGMLSQWVQAVVPVQSDAVSDLNEIE